MPCGRIGCKWLGQGVWSFQVACIVTRRACFRWGISQAGYLKFGKAKRLPENASSNVVKTMSWHNQG
ncbi:hypothetical protein EIKCOROL_02539 [Eikenella corrodens ATCC 23834]|uniref:Uncharacterized protein n=1 Tax=Eikenella corrodens ATCC 23834 TaxID=546274 RepID=C0DYS2_EIKCO|nr:hypothetical protein EIKCOROL_02539 [Eikenella corrodens ATCC 23834]